MRTEQVVVGRSTDADVALHSDGVSRRHVQVSRHGGDLLVQDLGSANGTYINGRRLHGVQVLRPGDLLCLADVEMEYVLLGGTGSTSTSSPPPSYRFGDVHGPANTGNPSNQSGSQVVGTGSIFHGDVHHGDRIDVDVDPDPMQELFSGRGPGRLLVAVGLVVVIVGFGIWMSVVFSGAGNLDPGGPSPFDAKIFGLSAPVTGFAMFAGGGLLTQLGVSMSRAARRRQERRGR